MARVIRILRITGNIYLERTRCIYGLVVSAVLRAVEHTRNPTFSLNCLLLAPTLRSHNEAPCRLLGSGAALWLTNVLVFALWYWRLDGGGPNKRDLRREFGRRSFVFPQMQLEKIERGRFGCERWRPGFVDYLFIAFTQSSTFGPTDAPVLARWAKVLIICQIFISLSIVVLLISRAVGIL